MSVLAAVVVLAVLAFAALASGGSPWISAPPPATGTASAAPSTSPAPLPASESATASVPPKLPPDPTHSTGYLFLAFIAVVIATVLTLLGRRMLRIRWRWRADPVPRVGLGATPETAPETLPAAVDHALAVVDLPDAREAVVQAWLLLGAAAAAAGTPARPAETAAEYAGRLAEAHSLPTTSVQHLAALYREARFSAHPVGAEQRARARDALETLRAALAGHEVSP